MADTLRAYTRGYLLKDRVFAAKFGLTKLAIMWQAAT
jgi:hypothetical protein